MRDAGPAAAAAGAGMRTLRLFIVDDHALVRTGLRLLLCSVENFVVAGEARSGTELLQLLATSLPDVVLLDMSMPGPSGADLIARVCSLHPAAPLLALSMHAEPRVARQALWAGACGYITKTCEPETLFHAVREVAAGRRFIDPQLAERMAVDWAFPTAPATLDVLTRREREVLQGLVGGASINAIALQLGISSKTVSSHKARLMEKMDFRSDAEMVRFGLACGLLDTGTPGPSDFP